MFFIVGAYNNDVLSDVLVAVRSGLSVLVRVRIRFSFKSTFGI